MDTGVIHNVLHLSQQSYQPNSRLVPGHNDTGYGIIEAANGEHIFFQHDVVESRFGFYDLRRGQAVEYTLEQGAYLRASSVRLKTPIATHE